ncbi:flavodoxin [Blautia obeum]|uniref:flavodoxin n=1 Tax=Blautia obeum TaxID=40520 RepID=UPI00210AE158|nr:flavodoxin [Blautia obeum]MCQ4789026.1 flavodoxin [Blautia obeum]
MSKKLVAYFSASGVTEKMAKTLAEVTGADLFEIQPVVPYTTADLDWMNKKSRSSVEMSNPDSRPEIGNKIPDMGQYDTVFVGFPIWWYVAPTIINTFLESYDFTGKKIATFATSGGSGMGKTDSILKKCAPNADWKEGKRFGSADKNALKAWAESQGM